MVQELGETRDAMAWDVWRKAESIASERKNEVKPFYIIYAAKTDPALAGAIVRGLVASGGIRQTFRLSYERPPMILGQLVWFVNNPMGLFEFVPQLSSPPDIPLDPSMLSDRKEDQFNTVMEKGKDMNVLVS
jgi:hypothetical protein